MELSLHKFNIRHNWNLSRMLSIFRVKGFIECKDFLPGELMMELEVQKKKNKK